MARRHTVPVLLALLLLPAAAPAQDDDRAELKGQIQAAIEKGKDYLLNQQNGSGAWAFLDLADPTEVRSLGATALCGLTLLECKVSPDDARIQKTARLIRQAAQDPKLNYNYTVNLCILFLHRVNQGDDPGSWRYDHPDAPLIRDLASRVLRGQTQYGGWGYHLNPGEQDNSNTQFAVVGLWVARKYFEGKDRTAITEALHRTEQKFRRSQHPSGSWAYDSSNVNVQLQPSPSMTCAGLLGLAVGAGRRFQAEFRGTGSTSGTTGAVYQKLDDDEQVKKARVYLENILKSYGDGTHGEHAIYFLWSLERTCVFFRWRQINGVDWHTVGSRTLIRHQRGDGSWNLDQFGGTNPETAFALLFLTKSNLLGPLAEAEFTYGPILAGGPTRAEKPKPRTPAEIEQRIKDVFAKLPTANPSDRLALLHEAETLPGDAVTQSLVRLVPEMSADAGKDAVRDTLAKRLQPWTIARLDQTLRESDHRELRLAAARAASAKTEPNPFDDAKSRAERYNLLVTLISTLSDSDTALGNQSALTLRTLTGQDFGKNQTRWSKWLDMNKPK